MVSKIAFHFLARATKLKKNIYLIFIMLLKGFLAKHTRLIIIPQYNIKYE